MVFSYEWDLKINGQSVEQPFGGLKFTHALSGFGTSGVVTGQFEFDIYDEFDYYGRAVLEDCPVQLSCKNKAAVDSRIYYISKRSISKKVCHFVAYDLKGLDREFDTSYLVSLGDEIHSANVLAAIRDQCGLKAVNNTYDGMGNIRFTMEQLAGKTCRGILEMVSTAMCGVWFGSGNGVMEMVCLDKNKLAHYFSGICTEYSEIDYQGRQKITKLIAVNSETGNVVTYSNGEYGTVIKIESPFVACQNGTDHYVWERIEGLVYQGWRCDKALMDTGKSTMILNSVSSYYTFGDDLQLLANQITFTVDGSGIYFSGGADPQSDEVWNYDDYLTRTKISMDKLVGNTKISSGGRIVFVDLNKEGG